MEALQMRDDGCHLDFEQITVGSVIMVEKDYEQTVWTSAPIVLKAGDIWVILTLASRPRCATLRNLQRQVTMNLRVDELLELDDRNIVTIGPA
jgi:hypothetical protein